MMDSEQKEQSIREQGSIFRRRLPLRVSLREILRALGSTEGLTCLEVGTENGAFSQQLRRHGGSWSTVAPDEETAERVSAVVGDSVQVMADSSLPFKKKLFDVILVNGFLERIKNDDLLIEECHRVLKPDGRIIVHVARLGGWSPILSLRRLMGPERAREKVARKGYTESDLFSVLKNGFDVVHMRSFSRFFAEFADLVVLRRDESVRLSQGVLAESRLRRLYAFGCFFYWLADQMDMLLLFSRGYKLIAVGKRRAWRPRNAPILVDGRSISEAVLSRAGD